MSTTTLPLGLSACLLMVGLAGSLTAQTAVRVRTVINNGPTNNRYDLVALGDGYTAAEESKFNADVQKFATALFKKEPYKTFKQFYNLHTVFRASAESGANHPDRTPPIVKNNAYGASYNTGGTARCLYIRNSSLALQDAAKAPANEGRIMVFVNDSRYGGCASTFAVSYNGSAMPEVQIHELGHSVGGLADEYDYGRSGTYSGGEPGQANVTASSTGDKWKVWHGFRGVKAFEGARYYKKGLWRPAQNCLMRSLGRPMCPICEEQTVLRTLVKVKSIDNTSPATTRVTLAQKGKQTFSFRNISPNAATSTVTWTFRGKTVATGATSFVLDAALYTAGTSALTVTVADKTPFVRRDPTNLLRQSHSWQVEIQGPAIPDFNVTYAGATAEKVPAGGKVELITVIQNDGFTTAPAARHRYVLSKDQKFSADDQRLRVFNSPTIKVKESHVDYSTTEQIPPHVLPGDYYIGLIADVDGKVAEISETNNASFTKVTIAKAACTPRLSFRDGMFYPSDKATASGVKAGQLLPTVTAPCNVGDGYWIVLSFSGTTPGVRLNRRVTLPLNWDLFTDLSIATANGPNLVAFRGVLDGNGQGKATLRIQANAFPKRTITGYMAAVIFRPKSGAFIGATNPVSVTLRP